MDYLVNGWGVDWVWILLIQKQEQEEKCEFLLLKWSLSNSQMEKSHHIWVTAAATKPIQSCPTLCDPIDSSPPGFPVPGILQARTLEWVAISFSNAWKWKVKGKSLSHVQLCAIPWTAAYQAPLPMGFSRQEYWGGVPLPSPNLSNSACLFLTLWEYWLHRKNWHLFLFFHLWKIYSEIYYAIRIRMQSSKEQGEIRKHASVFNAKK